MAEGDAPRRSPIGCAARGGCAVLVGLACLVFLVPFTLYWMRLGREEKESAALQVLKSLRGAEEAYRAKHKAYTSLDDLMREGSSPVGEGMALPDNGYTFTAAASTDHYTIVATPPQVDLIAWTLYSNGEIRP